MSERLYFFDLADVLGIEGGGMPAPAAVGPGGPDGTPKMGAPEGPGGMPPKSVAITHPNVWRKEGGKKLLDYLHERYKPGDTLDYDGHADCWLMLAVMDQMRDCNICTYIGAGFNKTLPIVPYQIGNVPAEGQPSTFSVREQGEDVLLTVHLDPNKGPFDMYFGDIVAPPIPEGKNLYIRLDGRHLLFTFPISLTYGSVCRSIIMDYDNECFCSVSNVPELEVGDLVKNPF